MIKLVKIKTRARGIKRVAEKTRDVIFPVGYDLSIPVMAPEFFLPENAERDRHSCRPRQQLVCGFSPDIESGIFFARNNKPITIIKEERIS